MAVRSRVREKLVPVVIMASSVVGGAGTAGMAWEQHQAKQREESRVEKLEERERESFARMQAIETNVAWLVRAHGGEPVLPEPQQSRARTAAR